MKSAEFLASSGNNEEDTLVKPHLTRIARRRALRNQGGSKVKEMNLAIDETIGSASKRSTEKETTETTEEIATIETMPTTQGEQPAKTRNNPPTPQTQWGTLEYHLLGVLCPMLGQQGGPSFRGMEISELMRNWERMAFNYRLSTVTKIESVMEYCMPEMNNSVNCLISMSKREMREKTQATREESQ